MPTMLRPSRAVFRFSGPDALKLLFDVVTGRIVAEAGPARWWALLSPQGKIQAEGLWSFADNAWWLDCEAAAADGFFKRMRMYRLRAKADIDDLRTTHAVGWSATPEPEGVVGADDRSGGLGYRIIATRDEAKAWENESPLPAGLRVAAGIAEQGPDFAEDSAFPHEIGMDLLGGVDFKKGCYIGQEVVSRMQHRGTARRRPVIVSGLQPDDSKVPVLVGSREAGLLGTVVDGRAVASLRLDRITDPAAATVAGRPVSLSLPGWATYGFGESGSAE